MEASKQNLALLSNNIFINNLKAKIVQCALVDVVTNNYLKLDINDGNTGANSLIENWNPSLATKKIKQEEFVPTKTLDQIILEERIDVNSV